jgi:predicted nucleotide-binding protein (sugar kinase/HSP70/actin superfamily)
MGQKSSIDKLPKKLRDKLLEMLNDPACTQAWIVEAINDEAGESVLSKSGVNRYAMRMKKFAEKNRQAREVAEMYLEKCGADTRNKLGKVLNEQIRGVAFDLMWEIEEQQKDGKTRPEALTEILYKLSRSLAELERAEKLNAERTAEIRKETLVEAAEIVEQEAKNAGLTEAALDIIKRKILGI